MILLCMQSKNNMHLLRITGLFLFLLLNSSSWAQVLTLDSCYEKAKRNYPLIKQYDLLEKSEEYTISNANKSYLPQISFTGIAGYIIKGLPSLAPGTESSEDKFQLIGIAQLNQTIWDGGATHAQKKIISAQTSVQKAEIEVALHSIQERVNQLFFSILLLDEQQNLLTLLTDNLNRNLKAVKLSQENGLVYSSDVDEVRVEILKTEQRIIEIQYTRQGYLEMLAMMMGQPLNSNTTFQKPLLAENMELLTINRPELSLYQHQRNYTETQNSLNKAGNMPKVGLLGAGIFMEPGPSLGTQKITSLAIAGLSVSWNTNNLYKSSNNRELTKLNIDRINNQQETFLFNTRLQMTQQRSDIEKQKAIILKDNDIVQLKSSIKKAYELKYQNGMCTMNDLLLATNGESEALTTKALHEAQLLMTYYTYKTTSGN